MFLLKCLEVPDRVLLLDKLDLFNEGREADEWQLIHVFKVHPHTGHGTPVHDLHNLAQVDVVPALEFLEGDSANRREFFENLN